VNGGDEGWELVRGEALRFDPPSANRFQDASAEEQERIVRGAAAFRQRVDEQQAEADRQLTPQEHADLVRIRAIGLPGLPLDEFLDGGADGVEWFGPIVVGGVAGFLGKPETFKSFGVLQLGLAGAAGGSWLGMDLGAPRPFIYITGEKSAATVHDRLRRISLATRPVAAIRIVHKPGISFGDSSWQRIVDLVSAYGPRLFVACDTLASLAGPGFDENSGKDMSTVLGAMRRITATGATVAVVHHPSKHGEGTGGDRLRGHSSLWGELDGLVEFTRDARGEAVGTARIQPKDGEVHRVLFRWDPSTFLLTPSTDRPRLTATAVADIVRTKYAGSPIPAIDIFGEFPGHSRSSFYDRLKEARDAGLVAIDGRGRASSYVPGDGRSGRKIE
jgi:hypothetical protein